MILSILAPIFVLFPVIYLFPPPNTLLSCYYYQIFCWDVVPLHVLSICHQDMWKNPLGLSCLLDFCYFSTHFQHFSVYSSRFYPDVGCQTHTTHLYLLHWTCNYTWLATNNVLFCMSCYYHSHWIIPYLAQILGFWVTPCGVKVMSLCHGWGWHSPQITSHIHTRHIQSIWAHWYAVHGHIVATLHSYTCWKLFQSQEGQYQQFGCWIPCWRIYEIVMMKMIRSNLIAFIEIIFYELYSVVAV